MVPDARRLRLSRYRDPLHLGAAGKAILAHLDDATRDAVLAGLDDQRWADGTIVDIDSLRRELSTVLAQGYATSTGERVLGVAAVAAPITDNSPTVVGSIGLSGPTDVIDSTRAERLAVEVRRAAGAISARYPVAA